MSSELRAPQPSELYRPIELTFEGADLIPADRTPLTLRARHEASDAERVVPGFWDGGTTYRFVTDGIESALVQARAAAGDGDVAIMGGATTINQYLAAGLIDELRLHIVPLTLGAGTRLFEGVPPLKLEQVKSRAASLVTHVTYRVQA